ncbi:MAG: hypothetical protein AB8H86_03485 [Polyangiales bacterium]
MDSFAVLPRAGWVPRGQDYFGFILFEEEPGDDEAKAQRIEGLPKYLRKGLRWQGPLLTLRRRDVATVVRDRFADGPTPELSSAQREGLSGPALRMATRAMASFGDQASWLRFHARVEEQVQIMHARSPIVLFVRSVLPDDGLDLSPELEVAYENAENIAKLLRDDENADSARRLMEELAVLACTKLEAASRFAPCLPYSFGMDEYSDASCSLLRALQPKERLAVLKPLAAPARIKLMLRRDVFPVYLETAGSAEVFTEAYHEALVSPETDTLHLVASAIHYAIHPAARAADPAMIEAMLLCLEARKDFVRWAMAIIQGLLPTLEWNPDLHARYKKILETSA